jgi:MFS family permease
MAVERHAGGPHLGGEPADGERLDFVAGTLLCGLGAAAGSFPLTLAGRAVAGLSGGVFPLAFGMARAAPPPARLPGVVAVLSAMFGIGGALGMVLSGPLADWFGTPWLFWPLLVPGLAALALVAALPATARPPGGRVDLAGAVLLAGALACLLLPIAAAMLLASPLSALLRARFAARTPLLLGALCAAAAFGALALAHERIWQFCVIGLLTGAAYGLGFAALGNLVVDAVEPRHTGAASGVNTIARTVGGALGAQLATAVLAARPGESGYTTAFAVFAGLALAGAAIALTLPVSAGAYAGRHESQPGTDTGTAGGAARAAVGAADRLRHRL